MKKGTRTIIILIVILAIAVVAYFVFGQGDVQQQGGLVSENTNTSVSSPINQPSSPAIDVGQEFISTLLNLQSINLDTTLFSMPTFVTLENRTLTFEDVQTNGRPNPFAPIGVGVVPVTLAPLETPEEGGQAADTDPAPAPDPAPFNPFDPFGDVDA